MANRLYPGSELEVVLLTIDTDRLRSEVRYEAAPGRELERRSALLQHTIYSTRSWTEPGTAQVDLVGTGSRHMQTIL